MNGTAEQTKGNGFLDMESLIPENHLLSQGMKKNIKKAIEEVAAELGLTIPNIEDTRSRRDINRHVVKYESVKEFKKADRFKTNLVNCARLSAFLLNIKNRPPVEKAAEYYAKSMMTAPSINTRLQ